MFNVNPKTIIQKYPIFFVVDITFTALMFPIFKGISLLTIKRFEPSYLCKTVSYSNTF